MTDLEKKFHREMVEVYQTAKKEVKYNAMRFLQLISEKGGVAAAKQLVMKDGGTEGFGTLHMAGRLDLSVEAHVIKPEYAELFTQEEIDTCRQRLKQYGFLGVL